MERNDTPWVSVVAGGASHKTIRPGSDRIARNRKNLRKILCSRVQPSLAPNYRAVRLTTGIQAPRSSCESQNQEDTASEVGIKSPENSSRLGARESDSREGINPQHCDNNKVNEELFTLFIVFSQISDIFRIRFQDL